MSELVLMRLAGVGVEVRCQFSSTERFCSDYVVDDLPYEKCNRGLIQACVSAGDIDRERGICAERATAR